MGQAQPSNKVQTFKPKPQFLRKLPSYFKTAKPNFLGKKYETEQTDLQILHGRERCHLHQGEGDGQEARHHLPPGGEDQELRPHHDQRGAGEVRRVCQQVGNSEYIKVIFYYYYTLYHYVF